MKKWIFILITCTITSCSNSSSSQKLTWYNNATISQISEDPDNPENVMHVSIGISQQVFYVSKKASNYTSLLEKLNQSYKKRKKYNIGIQNNTNMIKEINEVKGALKNIHFTLINLLISLNSSKIE